MKAGGRLQAAIEVLTDVETRRRPVTDALKDWGLNHRFAGSGDRTAIGNLVHDALRRRASLAHVMGTATPRALVLAAYAGVWGRGLDGLTLALTEPHAPEALDADERAALSRPDPLADAPDHVAADVPEWLAPSLARVFGSRLVEEGRRLAERAPVDIRVNTLKATRDKVLASLADFNAFATVLSPVGIRVPIGAGPAKPPHVLAEPGYQKGHFEIQDEGSQLAALIADAKPGEQVVDLCAGGGGKTLALSASMSNGGQIYAYDNDRRRFGDIWARMERAGVRNVQVLSPRLKSETPEPFPSVLLPHEGKADLVLVDAPCTGTGTWRRRPDAKWRVTEAALADRMTEQAAVLNQAARLVRPGGRIVYVTCSLLMQENEDRLADFLAHHDGFRLERPALAGLPGVERFLTDLSGLGEALRLTPASAGTDGFFVGVLRRG